LKHDNPVPANLDSERLVLGYLLLDNSAWSENMTVDCFSLSSHKRIFACIRSRLSIGRPIDLILLTDAMRRHKELDAVGGVGYLASLTEGMPRSMSLEAHIQLLKEKSALRVIIVACQTATERAYEQRDSAEIIKELKEQL